MFQNFPQLPPSAGALMNGDTSHSASSFQTHKAQLQEAEGSSPTLRLRSVSDGCTGQLTGRGTLGAGQPTAMILGQSSGGHSQVLLELLASLNQPQHPLCRLFGTPQLEDVAAEALPPPRVSASGPSHSSKNTAPESHDPKRRAVGGPAPPIAAPLGCLGQLDFFWN